MASIPGEELSCDTRPPEKVQNVVKRPQIWHAALNYKGDLYKCPNWIFIKFVMGVNYTTVHNYYTRAVSASSTPLPWVGGIGRAKSGEGLTLGATVLGGTSRP